MSRWVREADTQDAALSVIRGSNDVIFYDLETTGLKPDRDFAIEIAALKFKPTGEDTLEPVDTLHLYLKPPFALPEVITNLTGITDEMLENAPTYADAWDQIHAFFGDNPVLAGYNSSSFDDKFLVRMWKMFGSDLNIKHSADVLKMARERVPKSSTPNHKLGTMAALFGVDAGITFHNALDDVTVTKRLFDIFAREYIEEEKTATVYVKARPGIRSISYWQGFRGFSRVYVNLDSGCSVYFDIRSKCWYSKEDYVDINKLDMNYIESEVMRLSDCDNLAHFKGRIVC